MFLENFIKIRLDLADKIGSWDRCKICDREREEGEGCAQILIRISILAYEQNFHIDIVYIT